LPLIFAVVGWATEYYELLFMGGVFAFYASYTLVNEAAPLTENILMVALVYVMLAISFIWRTMLEAYREKKK
jgi:hypothetical protein